MNTNTPHQKPLLVGTPPVKTNALASLGAPSPDIHRPKYSPNEFYTGIAITVLLAGAIGWWREKKNIRLLDQLVGARREIIRYMVAPRRAAVERNADVIKQRLEALTTNDANPMIRAVSEVHEVLTEVVNAIGALTAYPGQEHFRNVLTSKLLPLLNPVTANAVKSSVLNKDSIYWPSADTVSVTTTVVDELVERSNHLIRWVDIVGDKKDSNKLAEPYRRFLQLLTSLSSVSDYVPQSDSKLPSDLIFNLAKALSHASKEQLKFHDAPSLAQAAVVRLLQQCTVRTGSAVQDPLTHLNFSLSQFSVLAQTEKSAERNLKLGQLAAGILYTFEQCGVQADELAAVTDAAYQTCAQDGRWGEKAIVYIVRGVM